MPALRSDHDGLDGLFAHRRPPDEGALSFYTEHINAVISWDLEDNAEWFRERFLEALKDEKSLIRHHIDRILPDDKVALLTQRVTDAPLLTRNRIDHIAHDLPRQAQAVVCAFRELLYHVSGARIVHCESHLPQEDYLDYDLADLSQRQTRLSQAQIFWKLFLELALESLARQPLPVELLDLLSFQDIIDLRAPLRASAFMANYDTLIQTAVAGVRGDELLLDVHQLGQVRDDLERSFRSIFEDELRPFLKKKIRNFGTLADNGTSVGLGLLGLTPGIGTLFSITGLGKDMYALVINLTQALRSEKAAQNVANYAQEKQKVLHELITRSAITEKTTMLDMVDLLAATIAEKMKL